ncbi:MAG: hypothetical protein AAF690_20935 [Acidobacteriota bacterium]
MSTEETTATDARKPKPGTALGLLALGIAAATLSVWVLLIRRVAIPENRGIFLFLCGLTAALAVGAFVRRTRWYGGIAAVLALAGSALFSFTVAISGQEVAPNSIRVGETIPQFTALLEDGDTFDSTSLRGQLVLLKFFRAHW